MNSRPLAPLDSTPTDGVPMLTARHFLIGRAMKSPSQERLYSEIDQSQEMEPSSKTQHGSLDMLVWRILAGSSDKNQVEEDCLSCQNWRHCTAERCRSLHNELASS